MTSPILSAGGSAGVVASVTVNDDGSLVVTDAAGVSVTLTRAQLTVLAAVPTGPVWDLTGQTTGAAYMSLTDNLASALDIKEGSNSYLKVVTTNSKEFLKAGTRLKFNTPTTVTMANAAHALVLGTAGAAQTQIVGRHALVTAGGAGLTLTLPTAADCAGLELVIQNASSDTFTVGGTLTASVAQGKAAIAVCDGTNWYSYAVG